MCGRFDFHGDNIEVLAAFGLRDVTGPTWPPRYNIAPTDTVPIIIRSTQHNAMRLRLGAFGWRKDFMPGGLVVNARAETVHTRPLFRQAFAEHRCVIPVNGFFEWEKFGKKRLPWYFASTSQSIFGIAGLYEPAAETEAASFVILTTEPNTKVAPVHNRMPVMLDPENAKAFVTSNPDDARAFLRPYDAAQMNAHRVNPAMSRAGYDGPACIEPL